MALQGTIDAFPVVDVLQLLSTSHKSGRLMIEGDRGVGQLFVVDGQLTAGGVRGRSAASGAEIVFELLRFGEGSFLFEPGETAPDGGFDPVPLPDLLAESSAMIEEWYAIEAVVPTVAHRVGLNPEPPGEKTSLTAQDWRIAVGAGTGTAVATLAEQLGLGEFDACRHVVALVERKVLVVSEPVEALAVLVPQESAVPALPAADDIVEDAVRDAATRSMGAATEEPVPLALAATGAVDEEAFPERFPIDDLLGAAEGDADAWVTLEGEGSDHDRFAAAQSFSDGFGAGAPDGPEAAADAGGYTDGSFNDAAFSAPAASDGTPTDAGYADHGAGDAAFNDTAFTDTAFTDTAFTDTAFSDAAFGDPGPDGGAAVNGAPSGSNETWYSTEGAFSGGPDDGIALPGESSATVPVDGDPGGFSDQGAFTDPVSGVLPAEGGREAATPRSNLAVQDPVVEAFTPAPDPPTAADDATDEVLRQMSKLSPKAAEAIAAALGSAAEEPAERASDDGVSFLRSI